MMGYTPLLAKREKKILPPLLMLRPLSDLVQIFSLLWDFVFLKIIGRFLSLLASWLEGGVRINF